MTTLKQPFFNTLLSGSVAFVINGVMNAGVAGPKLEQAETTQPHSPCPLCSPRRRKHAVTALSVTPTLTPTAAS